jgi:C-terminal processing protease CtpA/Prc
MRAVAEDPPVKIQLRVEAVGEDSPKKSIRVIRAVEAAQAQAVEAAQALKAAQAQKAKTADASNAARAFEALKSRPRESGSARVFRAVQSATAANQATQQLEVAKQQLRNQQLAAQLAELLKKHEVDEAMRAKIIKDLMDSKGPRVRVTQLTKDAKDAGQVRWFSVQEGEKPSYRIGINSNAIEEALRTHLNVKHGVVIDRVVADQPAAKVGLKRFDVLVEVNGKAITTIDVLNDAIQKAGGAKKHVTLHVIRSGKKSYVDVKPEKRERVEFRVRQIYSYEPKQVREYKLQYAPTQTYQRAITRYYQAVADQNRGEKSVIDYLKSLDQRIRELQKSVDDLQKRID